jgi:xylan 1,4-beta-xylosidase
MRGFDASLFHDGEESWLLNLVHDWRPGHGGSAGLEVTRYDRAARRLAGEPVTIVLPPQAEWVESPGLYRRGPWYYLLTADGGTGYQHQVTVARSRFLTGPYERDPRGPLITARGHPDLPLQKAGHGSLAETGTGQWYLAYLTARPQGRRGPCVLGRETALAPVTWTSVGWPRTPSGLPALDVPAPHLPAGTGDGPPQVSGTHPDGFDGFDEPALRPHWSTLRRPAAPDWACLTQRRPICGCTAAVPPGA